MIFLVPHGWAVDIPAMLMASQGQKMAAMFHNQGNPVLIMSGTRCAVALVVVCMREMMVLNHSSSRYVRVTGDIIYPIRIMAQNTAEFVDFFATYKATLPAIGRLMKVCRARCTAVSDL